MHTVLLAPVWPERGLGRQLALLEEARETWPFVGGEVRAAPGALDAAAEALRELRSRGLSAAVHLPAPEELPPEEAAAWLRKIRPDWAVVHGRTAAEGEVSDCAGCLEFLERCAAELRVLAASGVPVFVENAPPREPERDPRNPGIALGTRPLVRAGMFARDLLFVAERAGCGVLADTEHLLDAIFALRERARLNGALRLSDGERDFAGWFGFYVRRGLVLWSGNALTSLTLEGELSLLRPKRFHVTGSRAAVLAGEITSHAELEDSPFGRYLMNLALSYRPLSVTVESCHRNGAFDFGALERSLLTAARMLAERGRR